jgi:hypothetical protein
LPVPVDFAIKEDYPIERQTVSDASLASELSSLAERLGKLREGL